MDGDAGTTKIEFLVIGAALPRTGTMSLMYALELLLPGECYHGMKTIRHEKEWCDIMGGKYTDDDYKKFLLSKNYVAGLDSPFCFEYKRALRIFPNAKVILTVRDPEAWVKSMNSTLRYIISYSYLPVYIFSHLFTNYLNDWASDKSLKAWSTKLVIASRKYDQMRVMGDKVMQGDGVEYYKKWVHEVEATVPKGRLLKFNVKDGWDPLCKHLDVPIPDVPFPKVNSTDDFASYLLKNRRRAWLLLYEFISIPMLAYGVYKLSRE